MARLTPITSKDQVDAKDHAIVDAIIGSRGALQGPFSIFLYSPELAGRTAHLGAYVRFEGSLDMRVRVLAARLDGRARGQAGWVAPGTLSVSCGDGRALELVTVQRAGRKAMLADDFLRGFPLPEGTVLP